MKRFVRITVAAAAMVLCLVFVAFYSLYISGGDRLAGVYPPSISDYPQEALQLLWVELGGSLPRSKELGLFDFFRDCATLFSARISNAPEFKALTGAARYMLAAKRKPRYWHLKNFASALWLSGNWTTDETLAYILNTYSYGHGFVGLQSASLGYFGLYPADLTDAQIALLITSIRRPGSVNLWCGREQLVEHTVALLEKSGISVNSISLEATLSATLLPSPANACP